MRRQIGRAHQVKRYMGGTLSTSIEAHFDMDWMRGHTVRYVVEDEDEDGDYHTEAHGEDATEDNGKNDLVDY